MAAMPMEASPASVGSGDLEYGLAGPIAKAKSYDLYVFGATLDYNQIMAKPLSINSECERRKSLDAETLAALDAGILSEETGRTYTWEEAKKFARERRKALPSQIDAGRS